MSKTAQIILAVVAVVVIVGGFIWFGSGNRGNQTGQTGQSPQNQAPSQGGAPTAGMQPAASGNTNADLAKDAAQLDAQLSGLSAASAGADQGLNDQPVSQAQL